jgi:DHA2 family multidrug resistance protein-like MFS transporter
MSIRRSSDRRFHEDAERLPRKMAMTHHGVPARAGRREWIGLAVIALPCVLYSMDLTVLYLAIPHLSVELEPTSSQLLWMVDIYGFLLAGLLITMGTLGDRIGRRRLLLIGATAFGAASILAAFAPSANMLIAARALLGIAGATLAPSTLSLIRNMFHDTRQRTFAIGVWIASYSAGGAIGPLLGGVLLEHFWWGSVFLIAVPVMMLLLVLGPMLLPEFRDPNAGRLDLFSAGLSLAAVLSVIFGLKHLAQNGLGLLPAGGLTIGVIAGSVFMRRQRALRDPLIDLRLFRIPAFSAALVANTLSIFVAFGAFLFVAQYLQLVLGLSPLRAGLWTMPSAIGSIGGSMLAPVIVRRARPANVIAGGLAIAGFGLFLLTRADGPYALAVAVSATMILFLGVSFVATLATDQILGAAPPERAGAASALSETGAEFGGALGIAILGSIGTAVYRRGMMETLPSTLPPELTHAARSTLGGALAAAEQLPRPEGDALVALAQDAFMTAFDIAATMGAAAAITAAILSAVVLRRSDSTRGAPGVEGSNQGGEIRLANQFHVNGQPAERSPLPAAR